MLSHLKFGSHMMHFVNSKWDNIVNLFKLCLKILWGWHLLIEEMQPYLSPSNSGELTLSISTAFKLWPSCPHHIHHCLSHIHRFQTLTRFPTSYPSLISITFARQPDYPCTYVLSASFPKLHFFLKKTLSWWSSDSKILRWINTNTDSLSMNPSNERRFVYQRMELTMDRSVIHDAP